MKTCVFFAVVVVVGLSGGRFQDEKACCLSSKTREKNFCRGRMIGLSTERLEWRRLTVEICVMKRESDRKSPEERKSRACPVVSPLCASGLDLWPGPKPEVRDSRTSRHSAHAESQV